MKSFNNRNTQIFYQTIIVSLVFIFNTCSMKKEVKPLSFQDFPNLKLGFSTQNFLGCMLVNVENLREIIKYAYKEGYSFIELRDPEAKLSLIECKEIADFADSLSIEIIYEININLLASNFLSVFRKALENTALLNDKGILRTTISNSEFAADKNKKGWNEQELNQIVELAENCGKLAQEHNLKFIVENASGAFFGKDSSYFGFADFFRRTMNVGLQFDTANPFQNNSREKSNPVEIEKFLTTITDRWLTTHLKSGKDGVFQPILDDNPLEFKKVLSLMSANNIVYVAFELNSVSDKETCFENHSKSIDYLIRKGLMVR